MTEVMLVHPDAVADAWPMVKPLLAGPIANSQGCFEPEDVEALCRQGFCQLWIAIDDKRLIAAYVGKIEQFPRKRLYFSLFAGGEEGRLEDWLEAMLEAVEKYGRQWGCEGLYIQGRRGWSKAVGGKEIGFCFYRPFPAMTAGVH